ncbi:MAG: hypothetical protein K0R71_202 [Bacillales bacterium]|jgi:hypothetical protein|nr:hypothetical protein [Bacillales bacterium]
MRRIFLFCFILISIYAVYHDVTKGSLPHNNTPKNETKEVFQDTSFYLQQVQPGDTVIGIIEKNEETLPTSIEQIIIDFKSLNDGLSPEKIKIGLTYKFKRYH